MDSSRDDWISAMIQAIIMRSVGGAASESTIEERWHDIEASRSKVRIREYVGAVAGCLFGFLGLTLVGAPLALSGAISTAWDALLVGCACALVIMIFWAAVELRGQGMTSRRRWVVTGIWSTLVLAAVAVGAMRLGDRAEWWHLWAILGGLSVVVPSALFVVNQLSDLADPGGMRSAFERQIQPLLDQWMERQAPPKIVERPLIPWTHANRQGWIANQPEKENVINVPARDDLTLADFLREAISRGLGRRNWIEKGKKPYICPTSKERVTRPTYDRMIEMMERLAYIERGGDGEATRWLVEPTEAYNDWCQRIEDEWGELLEVNGEL